MIFRKNRLSKYNVGWQYGGEQIEIVDSFPYLGVTMTPNLKSKTQCTKTISKAKTAISSLERCRAFCLGRPRK